MRLSNLSMVLFVGSISLGLFACADEEEEATEEETTADGAVERELTCSTTGNDTPVSGGEGTSYRISCPPGCSDGTVYGTGTYSDDSYVCTAAIHDGAIPLGGGETTIVIASGQDTYAGTTANNVESSDWTLGWDRSFRFEKGENDGAAAAAEAVKEEVVPAAPAPVPVDRELTCSTIGNQSPVAGGQGTSYRISCPPGCSNGNVYGTGTYSDDSYVCTAAIHAGAIPMGGGEATIVIAPGQDTYSGSRANGVLTRDWTLGWSRSFRFE